jgi:hypothetical protein
MGDGEADSTEDSQQEEQPMPTPIKQESLIAEEVKEEVP